MSSNVYEVGAQAYNWPGMWHRTKSHSGTFVIELDDARGLAPTGTCQQDFDWRVK